MSSVGQQAETAAPPAIYKPNDIASLIVNSFRFSRGLVLVQSSIIGYMVEEYGELIDQAVAKEAEPIAIKAAEAILSNPMKHIRPPVPRHQAVLAAGDEVKGAFRQLRVKCANNDLVGGPLQNLTHGLVRVDHSFLPSNRSSKSARPLKPFESNVIKHGLLGNTTGRREYDSMFQYAGKQLLSDSEQLWWDDSVRTIGSPITNVNEVVAGHIATHPQDTEALRDVLRGTAFEITA